MAALEQIPIYIEVGKSRVFACAFDWPGWCRPGRNEALALEGLRQWAPRYAQAAAAAGLPFPAADSLAFDVFEHVAGNSTTDFGAPAVACSRDALPWTAADSERACALLEAAWQSLALLTAQPRELAKGPRGGGRTLEGVAEHVRNAEAAYARKLGATTRAKDGSTADVRVEILKLLRQPDTAGAESGRWLPRYAARRIAWHVIDHIWEIEDRSMS